MRYSKFLFLFLISSLPFSGNSALAAKNAKNKKPVVMVQVEPIIEAVNLFSADGDFKTSSAKLTRDLASVEMCKESGSARVDVTVSAVEAEIQKSQPNFLRLRDEVIGNSEKNIAGIKSKEQLDAFIKKYEGPAGSDQRKNYESLDSASRMLVLQLRALIPMKSFFFRAKSFVARNSITRTTIVTMLRAQAVGVQNFTQVAWGSTNPQTASNNSGLWEAAYNYMTEPFPDMASKIDGDGDLESFMGSLLNSAIRINNDYKVIVEDAIKNQSSFWWDNKLYLSIANFSDPKDRYIKLGIAELLAIRSALSLGVSTLAATTSYSFKGFQASIGQVGVLMGFTASNFRDVTVGVNGAEGMTSKNRFNILKSHKDLFTRKDDYKKRMDTAYNSLRDSVYQAKSSYDCVAKRNAGDQYLFDVRMAQSMNRIALSSFGNLVNLFEKKEVGSTVIAGEKINVDLWGFYNNPPASLSDLYPVEFNDRSNGTVPEVSVKAWGEKDSLRNFKYESARSWKLAEYNKLFPGIKPDESGQKTTEVGRYARILSQSWGSAVFAIPLSAFVF